MKDVRDPGTIDMTVVSKRGRGRPATGNAKSAAERMRAYRSRSVTVNRGVLEASLVDVTSQRNVTEIGLLDSALVNDLNDRRTAALGVAGTADVYLDLLVNSLGALDEGQVKYVEALGRALTGIRSLLGNVTEKGAK